jgi:hypothetical protein
MLLPLFFYSGTCTIGGKIINAGTSTTCPDNINFCGCFDTGSVSSTLIGYDHYTLCNAPNVRKFYDCEVYPEPENKPLAEIVDLTRRECIRGTENGVENLYCKHWACTTPDCPEGERLTARDGCQYCNGS